MSLSVMNSLPLAKLKCEQGDENSKVVLPSGLEVSLVKSTKKTQVLGTISMNQQQKEPAAKKRRVSDGSSSKVKPAPGVAVARRNARERNRVKQVNNGFSMLRDHIPPEIAETFEQSGRANAKKLSKVETLRMAVEYIRNLEKLLSIDGSNSSDSFSSFNDSSLPATPPPETQQPFFYALKPHGNVMETQITIVNGQQYVRIPGTNAFQLVSPSIFENEENVTPSNEFTTIQIHPPASPLMIQPTMNNLPFEMNSSTGAINSSTTPAGSISPYSGHSSLSPAPSHHADNISRVIMEQRREFKPVLPPFGSDLVIHTDTSHYDNIILKQEIIDESIFDENSLSNENMMDAMQWWEQQQNLNQNSP